MSDFDENEVVVKNGCLVRVVTFSTIKTLTTLLSIFLIIDVLFSCKLFASAIQIRSHLGYFINMISSGDGDTLPSLQAVPVLFFLLLNIAMIYLLYSIFDEIQRFQMNRYMFFSAIVGLILLAAILIIIICVISHAYSTHQKLHDGIVTAMSSYLNSTVSKSQIDRLQIEFQCCGSKKYDEWYSIKWKDSSLEQGSGYVQFGYLYSAITTLQPD